MLYHTMYVYIPIYQNETSCIHLWSYCVCDRELCKLFIEQERCWHQSLVTSRYKRNILEWKVKPISWSPNQLIDGTRPPVHIFAIKLSVKVEKYKGTPQNICVLSCEKTKALAHISRSVHWCVKSRPDTKLHGTSIQVLPLRYTCFNEIYTFCHFCTLIQN